MGVMTSHSRHRGTADVEAPLPFCSVLKAAYLATLHSILLNVIYVTSILQPEGTSMENKLSIILFLAFYFLITSGFIYDVIVDPPSTGR